MAVLFRSFVFCVLLILSGGSSFSFISTPTHAAEKKLSCSEKLTHTLTLIQEESGKNSETEASSLSQAENFSRQLVEEKTTFLRIDFLIREKLREGPPPKNPYTTYLLDRSTQPLQNLSDRFQEQIKKITQELEKNRQMIESNWASTEEEKHSPLVDVFLDQIQNHREQLQEIQRDLIENLGQESTQMREQYMLTARQRSAELMARMHYVNYQHALALKAYLAEAATQIENLCAATVPRKPPTSTKKGGR
jgi:hypothetical protein